LHLAISSCTVSSNSIIPKVLLYWWFAMTVAFVIYTVFLAGYVELYQPVAVRCTGTQDEREL
jgi:hypothetical protein